MSLFILKIIGIVTMFLDHYHYIVGGSEILNVIGRIAFPIFAFTLNEGYVHTRSLKKYLLRLFIFAVSIQMPSILFGYDYPMNIFFTLFLGLLSIYIFNLKKMNVILKIILIGFILFFSQKFKLDYGIYGILVIINFNIFRNNKFKILMNFLVLNIYNVIFPKVFDLPDTQLFSLISLVFIFMYNGEKGRSMKYFFYLFYPIHFFILEVIKFILEKM
ncbi:TraX family protein [Leptotrichia wadei]|uniref:TraX family protein n=1 Tax=Leptotrichia wadei TaxID=157687 RepID=A0A510KF91_9FUSO|nr:TraX family protein [Leptotrichia wadei]BBM48018.1 TraX family protein [Leptotrichia wadei]BBM50349.1 TraX family protein [Leptotrichia wadei]